ncbi:MAG: hypothetical protein KJ630_16445 [Proteobacteria bacterium]|nr:hypothetical protein [Pseudomonadota bacterium]
MRSSARLSIDTAWLELDVMAEIEKWFSSILSKWHGRKTVVIFSDDQLVALGYHQVGAVKQTPVNLTAMRGCPYFAPENRRKLFVEALLRRGTGGYLEFDLFTRHRLVLQLQRGDELVLAGGEVRYHAELLVGLDRFAVQRPRELAAKRSLPVLPESPTDEGDGLVRSEQLVLTGLQDEDPFVVVRDVEAFGDRVSGSQAVADDDGDADIVSGRQTGNIERPGSIGDVPCQRPPFLLVDGPADVEKQLIPLSFGLQFERERLLGNRTLCNLHRGRNLGHVPLVDYIIAASKCECAPAGMEGHIAGDGSVGHAVITFAVRSIELHLGEDAQDGLTLLVLKIHRVFGLFEARLPRLHRDVRGLPARLEPERHILSKDAIETNERARSRCLICHDFTYILLISLSQLSAEVHRGDP